MLKCDIFISKLEIDQTMFFLRDHENKLILYKAVTKTFSRQNSKFMLNYTNIKF